ALIPLLLQLLGDESLPRRDWIIGSLVNVARSANDTIKEREDYSSTRYAYEIMRTLEDGLPLFLRMKEPNRLALERFKATQMLLNFSHSHNDILPDLWLHLGAEPNLDLLAHKVEVFGRLADQEFETWGEAQVVRGRALPSVDAVSRS
ncbi:MAG: hypothetical protein AAF125_08500, partial [Chloroflexota bacterium]